MQKLVLITTIIALISISNLQAQTSPIKEWDKTFGADAREEFTTLKQTLDGGFILGGYSYSHNINDKSQNNYGPTNSPDYWVIRTDSIGNKLWDKTIGGNWDDILIDVEQTSDGGFILAGHSASVPSGLKSAPTKGGYDYWIVKLDASGNKLWDVAFGGSGQDYGLVIENTNDGGFILGGYSYSSISGDKSQNTVGGALDVDYWVVKLNSNGAKQWDKTFGGSNSDRLSQIKQTADGSYILAGSSLSGVSGDKTEPKRGFGDDFWIIKIDSIGNKLWDKTFGGSGEDNPYDIIQTADGGYMVGGQSQSSISGDKTQNSNGGSDYWIVKMDSAGNKQWDKTVGSNDTDVLTTLHQTFDGGYLLGGQSGSGVAFDKTETSRGGYDYWLIKLNNSGVKLWDKSMGGNDSDRCKYSSPTVDGGFILGGTSASGVSGDKTEPKKGSGPYNYWMVKLVPNCAALTGSLAMSCLNGDTTVVVIINGIQTDSLAMPNWTLTYTLNGITQIVNGSTPTINISQNASSGSVYKLMSLSSGNCITILTDSLIIPISTNQPAINLIAPDTLVSTVIGSSYEWKFNGTILTSTARMIQAVNNGLYTVRVNYSTTCNSPLSAAYNFLITGVSETSSFRPELYPNPTTGIINLEQKIETLNTIFVYNSLGQCILTIEDVQSQPNGNLQLDFSKKAKGMYLIQIISGNYETSHKIVVE